MEDLKIFDRRLPRGGEGHLPEKFARIVTPLRSENWALHLSELPDRECAEYVLRGLGEGFRIGFDYENCSWRGAQSNMLSARQNTQVIDEYLRVEREKGRVVGPADPEQCRIQVNRFGVIPKSHQPGKWRLIVDLSYPEGASVNDGIDPALCSLSYTSVDWAVKLIVAAGRGSLLAKLDLESAYRMIPVHPDDRPLLGMKWRGSYLLDTALPFGLRSAPKLFNVVADCLQWIFRRHEMTVIHYLDDFLLVGPADSDHCGSSLMLALELCDQLGVKVSRKKLEGPTTTLSFLGILLDTVKMEVRLPEDKLARLNSLIQQWRSRRSCTKRELLSLLGHLHHACQVVRPGRSFLRRMISLSKVAKQLHHHLRLNAGFRSDLEWWSLFVSGWNGVGMLASHTWEVPAAVFTSDASGSWGCGVFTESGQWLQFKWPEVWESVNIMVKELLPILLACAVWGKSLRGQAVQCFSDNAGVVAIVNTGKSQDDLAMHLLRCLFFFTATWEVSIHASHIAGKQNVAADALSRDNLPLFFQQVPQAAGREATKIPVELIKLLVLRQPDWTSASWRSLFEAILQKV